MREKRWLERQYGEETAAERRRGSARHLQAYPEGDEERHGDEYGLPRPLLPPREREFEELKNERQ